MGAGICHGCQGDFAPRIHGVVSQFALFGVRTRLVRNRTLAEFVHVFHSLPPAPNVKLQGEMYQGAQF
jgi:hypothetical protein